jgi:hypothetical protein
MRTRRNKVSKTKSHRHKSHRNKHNKTSKKWVTAVDAAQATLKKTGSLSKARMALRMQAAKNARKLFGSV